MDVPRRHPGKFVNYNFPKDHNIFDLDRSYSTTDCSMKRISEKSIDKLQKQKSPYFNGNRNEDYVRPCNVSTILSSEDKNYKKIMKYITKQEVINKDKLDSKPGLFFKEHHPIESKCFSSINMLNGRKMYGHKTNHINKFITTNFGKNDYDYSTIKYFNRIDQAKVKDRLV